MFQLLLFYYIVPANTKVRLYHYVLGTNKVFVYEGLALEIPNELYHHWVHELSVDDDGYLLAGISGVCVDLLCEDD